MPPWTGPEPIEYQSKSICPGYHVSCLSNLKRRIGSHYYKIKRWSVENETRCYGDIGCVNITREWYHLIHRPFNVFPLARNVINTRFILYTESNPTDGQILEADDKEKIADSNFNAKWMTKFIIHGFIDTPLSNWVSDMRDELITRGGLNVIVVDWAGGSLPLYTQVCISRLFR